VLSFGFWVLGFGFWVLGFDFLISVLVYCFWRRHVLFAPFHGRGIMSRRRLTVATRLVEIAVVESQLVSRRREFFE
jgi:hypothetical protein